MRLYHFCAPQFLEGIQREGLTKGCTPVRSGDGVSLIPMQQWLTKNPSFEQSWNGRVLVKYDRAAYRLTISIPKDARKTLFAFVPTYRQALGERMLPDFDADEDCKNWFVFIGKVKAGWIRHVSKIPTESDRRIS
jgi:hypothetical protein